MKPEKHYPLMPVLLALALFANIVSIHADEEVSNLASTGTSTEMLGITSNVSYALSFTTGSNPAGYTLNDLSILIYDTGDPGFQLTLESNTVSNTPNDSLTFALTKQSEVTDVATYTPSQSLVLAASTTYWVVASSTDNPSSAVGLITTNNSAYVGNDGWTLGTTNGKWGTGGGWYNFSSPIPMMVSVNATATPEPSSVALFLVSLGALWIFRRKLKLS